MGSRGRCRFPWSHQDYLRLDDYRVECVVCGRIRREPRRAHKAAHLPIPRAKENNVLESAQRILKALAAAGSAALASYGVAVQDGNVGGDEWITLVVAALGTALVVWAVPNRQAVQ